ncbi:MAG: tetratricopeptide repeat protein, partial [Opitutae bacterium]|nr:tetratricopeptide repeat protein [Opitutae bacterium]
MEQNAKKLLERAIELDPNLANAHFKLGVLYQSEQKYDLALKYFEQAVSINSTYAEAECELAIELTRLSKHEDAREHFL